MTLTETRQRVTTGDTIRLRSVAHPFAARIGTGPGCLELWLPAHFGRRRPFTVPLSSVSVVELDAQDPSSIHEERNLTIPYLNSMGEVGRANLALLFGLPQRLPRPGWRAIFGVPGLPGWQANRPEGLHVDGVALQVRGPVRDAIAKLTAVGVEEVESLEAWAVRTRPVRPAPTRSTFLAGVATEGAATQEQRRPSAVRGACFGLVGVVVGGTSWAAVAILTGRQFALVALGAGLLIAWLVPVGARGVTPALRAVIAAETLAAVVAGVVLAVVSDAWVNGGELIGPVAAVVFHLDNWDSVRSDLVFALLSGVLGASLGVASTAPPARQQPVARHAGRLLLVVAVAGLLYLSEDTDGAAPPPARGEGEVDAPTSAPANELRVGDCLDAPTTSTFELVDLVPCAQPHDIEIYGRVQLPWGAAAEYPGNAAIEDLIDGCMPGFHGFVGYAYEWSELEVFAIWPDADRWAIGDREMLCGVTALDGSPTTGTLRDAGR
jgi:hypothetical protein